MEFIESLKQRLDKVQGEELLQTLTQLADLHQQDAPEASIAYSERAIEVAQQLQDRKSQASVRINLGQALIKRADYSRASSFFEQALEIAEELHDNVLIEKSLDGLGKVNWYLCDYENAILFYLRLLDVRKRLKDPKGVAVALSNIGLSYKGQGQFRKALESLYSALEISEKEEDDISIANTLNNIALVQHRLRYHDKALESHEKALRIREQLGDETGVGHSLNNIGGIFCDLGQTDKALECFNRALDIKRKLKDSRSESNTLNNIGNIHRELGEYDAALEYYDKSLAIKRDCQDIAGVANIANNIADCYLRLNQPDKALPFIQEAETQANAISANHILIETLGYASRYHEMKGEPCDALARLKRYIELKEEIYSDSTTSHLTELQARYEKEKQNREIEFYRFKMHEIQSVLNSIANAARSAASIDELYAMIKSSLSRLIDTTNFYIALYDKHTDMITTPFLIDNKDDIRCFPARKTMTSMVIKRKSPVLADAKIIEQFILDGEIELLGAPAKIWLGVPLIVDDEVIGVIAVQSYSDETKYKEEDLELLQFVSFQVALAIERKHKESELNFQGTLLDNIRDQVIATDLSGQITYVNKAVNRMLGFAKKELIGNTVHILNDDSDEEYGVTQQMIIEETVKRGQWRGKVINRTREGEKKFLESRTWLIFDENDQPKGMVGVSTDISDRIRTEAERLRLATAIEQAAEAVIITDRKGNIEYVNPAFEQVTGYKMEEVTGSKPSILKSGKQDAAFYRGLWKTILSGKIWKGQMVNQRKDGAFYDEEATITPIRDENDVITNFVAVKRDVSEERRLEAQLMQSQKMEAIGTLAGGIAHDFNNILSLILGYTELAAKLTKKESKVYASLEEVTKAGNRAKDLVQQILAFSRQSEQQKKTVQVRLIVKEALKMLRSSLPATIQIEQDLQSDSVINADPTQIHQIVMNLCTNAYHAMRDEGGVLRLHLTDVTRRHLRSKDNKQTTARYLKMTVSDTGHGIPQEIIDRIFEPYFTTKGKGEGTGLGLAIIHGIVTSHDGHIEVSSKINQGTTFDIYFPVVEDVEETIDEEEIAPEDVKTSRIMFVDDEESLAELYTKTLQSFGHVVTPVTSATEALRILKRKPGDFDIVVTDLTMPKMTGVKMAIEMQKIRPGMPVILCSGYSENVEREKFESAGIRDLIIKPISTMKLINCIEEIMTENS